MGFNEEKRRNIRKFFLIFGCILISGLVAKIVYVLFALGLMVLIPGGSGVKGLTFIFALGLTIFTWVSCFNWLYTHFKKEFNSTRISHNKADEPDVKI
jgi:hypothetical protein